MTPREIEVMRGKNALFILLLTIVIGSFVGSCPPWGTNWQGTFLAPLFTGLIQFLASFVLYHAKGDFQLPTWIGWTMFTAPLSMSPALLLWPADNEVAVCCFMVGNTVCAAAVYWKGQIDFSSPTRAPVIASMTPATPQTCAEVVDEDLPAALERVREIINTEEASPRERMLELEKISRQIAEGLRNSPVLT